MGRTVLVTGGAGYVGSHCCKAFSKAGWDVVVYDNLSRGWKEFVRWGPLVEGDIRDRALLTQTLSELRPDAVAHFAALAYVGESVECPDVYYETNVAGSINLFLSMREAGVRRLLFSSTCATYGTPQKTPIDEDHPQCPINPYGASKLMVERIIRDFAGAHEFSAACLRYFNAAGGDPQGEIGERHDPETHVIPLAVLSAIRGSSFKVMGTDYPTRDGSAVRDFVHVSDLADAHLRALENLNPSGSFDALNLGTGEGTSVLEIADAVGAAVGRRLDLEIAPRRDGDPPELVADATRARRILGWSPCRSDIDTIVEDAIRWHRSESDAAEVSNGEKS